MLLSREQTRVCELIALGMDVCVTAHAGSGKTATLLEAVRRDTVSTLFMEYNKALKEEARRRAAGLPHVQVHNYDSALLFFYDDKAADTDFSLALRRTLKTDAPPIKGIDFERLVVDETQDLTEDYMLLLLKLLRDNASHCRQIIIVGDPKQCINAFRGASACYLRACEESFSAARQSGGRFAPAALTQTFRFGVGMCQFVNDFCRSLFTSDEWQGDHVHGPFREAGTVRFWIHDTLEPGCDALRQTLSESLRRPGTAGPVALLAASLVIEQAGALWALVENSNMAGNEPPLLLAGDDEPRAASDGSCVLMTVHKAKGKEFDDVFLFLSGGMWIDGANNLARGAKELLYVAVTRARLNLHIILDASEALARRWSIISPYAERIMDSKTGSCVCAPVRRAPGYKRTPKRVLNLWKKVDKLTTAFKDLFSSEYIVCRSENADSYGPITPQLSSRAITAVITRFLTLLGLSTIYDDLLSGFAHDAQVNGDHSADYKAFAGEGVLCTPLLLRRLAELPQGFQTWAWPEWLSLASLNPNLHYGHVYRYEPEGSSDTTLCEEVFVRLRVSVADAELIRHHDRFSLPADVLASHFANAATLRLCILSPASSLRTADQLAGAYLADSLGASRLVIQYVQLGRSFLFTVHSGLVAVMEKQWSARV